MGVDLDARAADGSNVGEISQFPTVDGGDVGTSQPTDALSQEDEMRPRIEAEDEIKPSVEESGDWGDKGTNGNVRKPWKEKNRIFQSRRAVDEIEIFESKTIVKGPSHLAITPPDDKGYIKIVCRDEAQFVVPVKVVEAFECVDLFLHSDPMFKEKVENVIRFPDIQPEIMEYVLRFVFIEHLNKLKAAQYWGANSPRLVFQFEVNPLHVMDLICVAHFLGIQDLLNVTATMVARHLRDVPELSSMPVDLAWCVAEQFTAQELFEAEEREDFLSLNLETESLWEKLCDKFLIEDIIRPTGFSESPPSYETWGLSEGPPPMSWKGLYMALDLQQLADRQDGSGNESFFAEIEQNGKYAYSHTVRPMFYDWVLRAPKSLSFHSYISHFPNLLSLHLVKLPLGNPLADGEVPCMVVGEILKTHLQLQILDVSETGFTTEATLLLSQSLQSHPRLQVLRLAYNPIGTEGFIAIVQALPHVRTLKLLDVRANGIASSVPEYAVAALQASALEEILLEANLKAWRRPNTSMKNKSVVSERANTALEDRLVEVNLNVWSRSSSNGKGPGKFVVPERHVQSSQSQQSQETPFQLNVPVLNGIPSHLRKLQLPQCDLLDQDISTLVIVLTQNNSIQKLDLSDNFITATGATSIWTWLQGNESLLELDLGNNRITDACSMLMLQTLMCHRKLQKLSLRGSHLNSEENLSQVIMAAVARGESLVATCGVRFSLDLRGTDILYSSRSIIHRQSAEWSNKLHLFI